MATRPANRTTSEPAPRGGHGEASLVVRRVRDLAHPPLTCPPGATVAEAAGLMTRQGSTSVIVAGDGGAALGIVTDRDLTSRVVARRLGPDTPVADVMSSPVVGLGPEVLAVEALLEMTRRNIHHLAVTEGGRVLGVVSSNDLLRFHAAYPVALVRAIETAESLDALLEITPRREAAVRWLAASGAAPADLMRVVGEVNDHIVRRVAAFAEASLEASGHGPPPVPYSWLAAGSWGRREQTLKTDQDNGIVYADPPPELREPAAAYFGRLAVAIKDGLVRLGFPPCDGGFMASNPRWCQPASVWRGYYAEWMERAYPETMYSVELFFDVRPVVGADGPGAALWDWVCGRTPGERLFLRAMARAALERRPALRLFGRFAVGRRGPRQGMLDLKGRGAFPLTQALRVFGLALGLREPNSIERLRAAAERGLLGASAAADVREAYDVIFRVRLAEQLRQADAGAPPGNDVNPDTLGKADRLLLREAFRTLGRLQQALEARFVTPVHA